MTDCLKISKPGKSNIAFLSEIEEVTNTIDPASTFDWCELEKQIQINNVQQTANNPAHANPFSSHAHADSHSSVQSSSNTSSSPSFSKKSTPRTPTQTTSTPTPDDFEMNLGQSEVIEQVAESSKTNEEPEEVVKMEVAEENNESVEEIEEIGLEDNFLDEPSSSSGASGIPINVFNVETKTESADIRLGFILIFL